MIVDFDIANTDHPTVVSILRDHVDGTLREYVNPVEGYPSYKIEFDTILNAENFLNELFGEIPDGAIVPDCD